MIYQRIINRIINCGKCKNPSCPGSLADMTAYILKGRAVPISTDSNCKVKMHDSMIALSRGNRVSVRVRVRQKQSESMSTDEHSLSLRPP